MKTTHLVTLASLLAVTSFASAAPKPAAQPPVTASEPVTVTVELDRPVQPANKSGIAVIKVSLLPEQIKSERARPPVNLAIALDRSGSMNGRKIEHAKQATLEALKMLGEEDRIALIAYDDDAKIIIESQPPLNRKRMASAIRDIRPDGATALYAGVDKAAGEIRRGARKGSVNRIVLLSDGQANVGPSSTEALRQLGRRLAAEDIYVSSIGLGNGFNEDLMTGIAQTGQGNSYFVENTNDLSRIFKAELNDVLSVAATEVVLNVEFSEGVRPVRIIGREGKLSGQRASFDMNQLIGGQKKFALIEVEVPHGHSGHKRSIAEAKVNYRHASENRPRHHRARAEVRYSDNEETVRKAVNPHVARAVVDNRVAVARREAIAMSDAGENRKAAAMMRALNREIAEMNVLYRDEEIERNNRRIDADARQLDESQLSNTQRKAYRNSSYQTVNQQRKLD